MTCSRGKNSTLIPLHPLFLPPRSKRCGAAWATMMAPMRTPSACQSQTGRGEGGNQQDKAGPLRCPQPVLSALPSRCVCYTPA